MGLLWWWSNIALECYHKITQWQKALSNMHNICSKLHLGEVCSNTISFIMLRIVYELSDYHTFLRAHNVYGFWILESDRTGKSLSAPESSDQAPHFISINIMKTHPLHVCENRPYASLLHLGALPRYQFYIISNWSATKICLTYKERVTLYAHLTIYFNALYKFTDAYSWYPFISYNSWENNIQIKLYATAIVDIWTNDDGPEVERLSCL